MPQSWLMLLGEVLANVAVGYVVAVLTQIMVFPLLGLQATLAQNLGIGAVFTLVSIVRSYALRRAFEALGYEKVGLEQKAERMILKLVAESHGPD